MSTAAGMLHSANRKHVQATAKTLRDGFPYFAHHDSVSALWAIKCRPPCAVGLYPFTEAKVEDFDPIFERLVALSRNDPAFLRQPNDYAAPFMSVAKALVVRAETAQGAGDKDAARDFWLRAAAVYRIARFPINRSASTQEAWTLGKAAYEKGASLLDPPSIAVEIPFAHADVALGDRVGPICAYLRLPTTSRPKQGWPVLLFICGLDAYRTDNTTRTQIHLDHGFATLSFEIPGTGDSPAAPNDPKSPDRVMDDVLDWVAANASRLSLDISKIVARGISTGGYYAFRVAHTHAHRLFAAVAQGGGCHHIFDADWIVAQNQMEYPFALADALAYKFGYRSPDPKVAVRNYAAEAHKFSLLESGLIDQPSCQLLAINGMEDSIFPIEDSIIVATHGAGKDLLARGSRSYMGNPGGEELVYQWLDRIIAGKPQADCRHVVSAQLERCHRLKDVSCKPIVSSL